jgi:hypothetical protein
LVFRHGSIFVWPAGGISFWKSHSVK